MVDSYSVTHNLIPKVDDYGSPVEGAFDIVIHTEVTPEVNALNYNTVPKLKYYYLSNSQGYIQISDSVKGNVNRPMFLVDKDGKVTNKYNTNFTGTQLKEIYVSTTENFVIPETTIGKTGKFNFPKPYTYHGRMIPYEGDMFGTVDQQVYTKFIEGKYHRIDYSQVSGNLAYYTDEIQAKFYKYNSSGQVHQKFTETEINESFTYYVREPDHIYHDINRDTSYKTATLYKIVTSPLTAQKEQLEDTTLEKFQYQEVHTYRAATQKDKESGKKLYYKEGDDYKSLVGVPDPNKPYYVLEIEYSLVSIGTVVDQNKVTGEIYYYPDTKTYEEASQEDKDKYYDESTYPDAPPFPLYRREDRWKYIAATEEQISSYLEYGTELYYSTDYILIPEIHLFGGGTIFMVVPMDTFVDATKFNPDQSINYIYGKDKPTGDYPKDDPIYLYTLADFIPENLTSEDSDDLIENGKYKDVKLASITLPSVVYTNGLDLPFKYDYTIVPCMNYGRLDHLAVSNTIDFSKLHAFNQSTFSTWKYRIDNNQLRLTFGADVYDTYETYKVDGLVLEFYDCWGFAGSLEIVDKKSYSGIFTKIIPLNSLKALSRKKILANDYSEKYVRNINIKEKFNETTNVLEGYIFNDKPVSYANSTEGWSGIDDEENNDCGTLYSNILYGVKAYLRRTTKNGKEFLHKQDFFLYTLPIYNDFYYQIDNFNNLQNPQLDLMLTYKIKDTSNRIPYTTTAASAEDPKIDNGYVPSDKKEIGDYLGGFSDKSSIDVIKYYKYSGTSDLYLEVGLKKDYEDLNISYSSDINKIFSCKLWLISDEDENKTFSINSGIDGLVGESQILNYNNGEITVNPDPTNSVNYLRFESGERTTVADENFYNANFITNEGNKPVKINYQFVVGYTANINDIRNTQVQATTICALCHKQSNGEYNYEDFGVYEQAHPTETNPDGSAKMELLSSVMFYNEGTAETEIFGTCRQIATTGNIMLQCGELNPIETEAQEIKIQGKLNTGEPLKQLAGTIGKLSFCQPHAHGLSDVNGVNIHGGQYNSYYAIPPDEGGGEYFGGDGLLGGANSDDSYGIAPLQLMYNKPLYNLSVNTKNTLNYYSEFISTIDYDTLSNVDIFYSEDEDGDTAWHQVKSAKKFTGFTGSEISTFNSKMLETFKHVYAYNPDYDSLTVNVGNISLQDYNPYFTSNLISEDSKLNFKDNKTLNDFIYFGPVNFATYLQNLKQHSKSIDESFIEVEFTDSMKVTHFLPQVQLLPNYDYCGTPESYYLLTNLTYNTPVPRELEQELEFSSSDNIVIKHHTGDTTFMKGVPNKKTLYGYNDQFNKMIQLDVSNYTIDSSGKLSVKNTGTVEKFTSSLELDTDSAVQLYQSGQYSFTKSFTNLDGEQVELDLRASLSMYSNNGYLLRLKNGTYTDGLNPMQGCVYGIEHGVDMYNSKSGTISITPKVQVYNYTNKEDYTYTVTIDNVELEYTGVMVNDDLSLSYGASIRLMDQDYTTLSDLTADHWKNITLIDNGGNSVNTNNRSYQVNMDEMSNRIIFKELYESVSGTLKPDTYGTIDLNYNYQIHTNPSYTPGMPEYGYDGNYVVLLFDFKIKKINFTVTQTSKLETSEESFIKTTRTSKYATTDSHKYTVMTDYKLARIRGSSITLNDLVYEPNKEGHRLFMRNNLYKYDPSLRSKIYYRFLNEGKWHSSWKYNDTKYLNNLFLYTGPCYTSSNLYNDD